jgi:hypothetical protein
MSWGPVAGKKPEGFRVSFPRHPSTTFKGASYTSFNQNCWPFEGLIKEKNLQIALKLPNLNVFI